MVKKRFIIIFLILELLLFVTACEPQNITGKAVFDEDKVLVTTEKFGVSGSIADAMPKVPEIISIEITTINLSNPLNSLGLSNNVIVTFNEAIYPTTVNQDTFRIKGEDDVNIKGEITSDLTKKVWTFNITDNLKSNSGYTIIITTDVKGISGNYLNKTFMRNFTKNPTSNFSNSFVSAQKPQSNQTGIDIGTVSGSIILTKSGISIKGITAITGSI